MTDACLKPQSLPKREAKIFARSGLWFDYFVVERSEGDVNRHGAYEGLPMDAGAKRFFTLERAERHAQAWVNAATPNWPIAVFTNIEGLPNIPASRLYGTETCDD